MQLIGSNKLFIVTILVIFCAVVLIPNNLTKIKNSAYNKVRNLYKIHMNYSTSNFKQLSTNNFQIKYNDVQRDSVRLVAQTADEIFVPVNKFLSFTSQGKVPVIIYPTMKALNKSFGWDADKSPMGVYWMGTIRILAPEGWIDAKDMEGREQIFKSMGPMVHEYAHYVVDYKTSGNYTRWFTEGVAQYVEKKFTGYTLDEPTNKAKLNPYPFTVLDRDFDLQENQELAYWQSLMAVEYLVEKHGEEVINKILDELALGTSLNNAFIEVVGQDLELFEENIIKYTKNKVLN